MRKLMLLLLFYSFCLALTAQNIKQKTYSYLTKKEKITFKIEQFNTNGDLIFLKECVNEDCSKADEEVYIYNNRAELIEDSNYTNRYGYHLLTWYRKYTYTDDGKLKTIEKVNRACSDGFDEKIHYYYNEQGILTRIFKQYKCDQKHYADYPILCVADDRGNTIEKLAMHGYDTLIAHYKRAYTFDENNNLTSESFFYSEEDSLELLSLEVWSYNDLNQKVLLKTDHDSIKYSYLSNGLLKTKRFYPSWFSDEFHRWYEYKYDSNNNLIERQLFLLNEKGKERKGHKEIIEYEYY